MGHQALLGCAAATSRRLGLPYGAATLECRPYAYRRGQELPAGAGPADYTVHFHWAAHESSRLDLTGHGAGG